MLSCTAACCHLQRAVQNDRVGSADKSNISPEAVPRAAVRMGFPSWCLHQVPWPGRLITSLRATSVEPDEFTRCISERTSAFPSSSSAPAEADMSIWRRQCALVGSDVSGVPWELDSFLMQVQGCQRLLVHQRSRTRCFAALTVSCEFEGRSTAGCLCETLLNP